LNDRKITGRQLTFSVACFIHGSTLLSSFVVGITKQDTWVAVLMGFLISMIPAFMYITLAKKFSGKNIIFINEIVFGKVLGKFISALYVLFFFSLVFLNTREVGMFVTGYVLSETPLAVVSIMLMVTCAYAANKGIVPLARIAFLCMALMIAVKVLSTVLLIPQMDLSNFAPSFTLPLIKYIQSAHTIAILPFDEVMVFLMIFPYVEETSDIGKSFIGGIVIGFVLMFIICIRDWAVFGPISPILSQLTFQTARILRISDIINRTEVFFAIVLFVLQFFKISILLFATTLGVAQLFGLNSYKPIVLIVGAISVCFSIIVWDSVAESVYWGSNVAAVYSSFFEVVLPAMTLLVILIKKKSKKAEVAPI